MTIGPVLIEVMQLTGNWFLYPCPYRLFDVDDLIANTAGALAGAVAAPLLRFVPWQGGQAADPGAPRPVTTGRRLLGVVCDLLGFWLAGGVVTALLNTVSLALAGGSLSASQSSGPATGTTWVVWAALFVVLPMLGRGGTLGQRTVLLHPVLPDGCRPSRGRLLGRSLAGTGGFVLLHDIGGGAAALGLLWGLICLVGVIRTPGHRGIAGVWTGTVLQDRRLETDRAPESPARPDRSSHR